MWSREARDALVEAKQAHAALVDTLTQVTAASNANAQDPRAQAAVIAAQTAVTAAVNAVTQQTSAVEQAKDRLVVVQTEVKVCPEFSLLCVKRCIAPHKYIAALVGWICMCPRQYGGFKSHTGGRAGTGRCSVSCPALHRVASFPFVINPGDDCRCCYSAGGA
jgi:hypothetical protein